MNNNKSAFNSSLKKTLKVIDEGVKSCNIISEDCLRIIDDILASGNYDESKDNINKNLESLDFNIIS